MSKPSESCTKRRLQRTFKGNNSKNSDEDHIKHGTTSKQFAGATKKLPGLAPALKIKSLMSSLTKHRQDRHHPLGARAIGTLFGYRCGHVHFALQNQPASHPAFLVELATPIGGLVREMASGLVRIALECCKEKEMVMKKEARLYEEPIWRTYCNGKKYGFAIKKEYGGKEASVLKAVERISMGAGVLPQECKEEGGVMYMRATFERVVGSRDSEAFYMMNPDNHGAPELSVYLLRL